MKLTKTLCLAAMLCCVPASVVMTGCGGGGSSLPANTNIVGNYAGTLTQTKGNGQGSTARIALTISSNGNIVGTATDSEGTSPFTGKANLSTGEITLAADGGEGEGQIRVNGSTLAGSGTFEDEDGSEYTLTFSKIS